MVLPDTLSRAQLLKSTPEINDLEFVSMINFISVSDEKYAELQAHTREELSQLHAVSHTERLARHSSRATLLPQTILGLQKPVSPLR